MRDLIKRYRNPVLALIAVAIVLALYAPHASNADYTFDDAPVILNNTQVTWPPDLQGIFHGRYFGDKENFGYVAICRPLATLSFALEVGLGLVSSRARHLLQLGLYICLCFTLARLVYRLLRATAFEQQPSALIAGGGALLFALHPTHAEVCMSLAYRPELLALLFISLATSILLDFRLEMARRWHLPLLWLCFSAALLSKESAIAALGPWLAWALCHKGVRQRLKLPVLSLMLPTLAFLIWRRWNIGALTANEIPWHDNPLIRADLPTRIVTSMQLTSRALEHLLWPRDLAPDYTFNVWPVTAALDARAFVGLALLLGLPALALLQLRAARSQPALQSSVSRQELAIVALIWPLAFWLPVANLLFVSTVLFADRLLFAIGVPLCWAVPAALCALFRLQLPRVSAKLGGSVLVLALVPIAWTFLATKQRNCRGLAQRCCALSIWGNQSASVATPAIQLGILAGATRTTATGPRHVKIAQAIDARDANVLTLGLELAQKPGPCDSAQPYLATLNTITKPAISARLAAVNWAVACKSFAQGWEIAQKLPPRVPSDYRQKSLFSP